MMKSWAQAILAAVTIVWWWASVRAGRTGVDTTVALRRVDTRVDTRADLDGALTPAPGRTLVEVALAR